MPPPKASPPKIPESTTPKSPTTQTRSASASDVPRFRHEALATIFRVSHTSDGWQLTVLGWQRSREPFCGAWSVPSGAVAAQETIGAAVTRHLASKVELTEIAHLEQLETRSEPGRDPFDRTIATAYLGLVPTSSHPTLPANASWLEVSRLPTMAFDHASVIATARDRLRAKLSYTNLGFALAPPEFTISQLRSIYRGALGYDISATNLQRVLQRRGQLIPTGATVPAGAAGGRPARLFRFTSNELQITDEFVALRP